MVLYCAVFTNIRGYLFGYFKPIAQNVYGDSALWFLIADANGLSGNSDLTVGQALNIPSRVSSASGANTFTPYNASKVIGDTSPNLPQPVAQAQGGGGGGCGGLGTILMIVVIAVVTIYTAGAATAALSTTLSGAATAGVSTMTLGATALAGGAGMAGLAGAMIGAAVGNIAGQAFAVGTGMQKDFNWSQVGLSALTAGITAGIGSYFGPVTNATPWYSVAGRAALGAGLSQGIGDQLGMGVKFSWTNVAMAAVSSGVNSAVKANTPFNDSRYGLFNDTMNGFATGMTMNALRGGQMTPAQVATDAFGNALGSSIVAQIQETQQATALRQASIKLTQADARGLYPDVNFDEVPMPVDYSIGTGKLGGPQMIGGGLGVDENLGGGGDGNAAMYEKEDWSSIKRGQATVAQDQAPLAALRAAGLSQQEAQAMYGQMRRNGQIKLNADGVPQVQPGQVLDYNLSDMSGAALGGREIGRESAIRAAKQAEKTANEATNETTRLLNRAPGQRMTPSATSEARATSEANNGFAGAYDEFGLFSMPGTAPIWENVINPMVAKGIAVGTWATTKIPALTNFKQDGLAGPSQQMDDMYRLSQSSDANFFTRMFAAQGAGNLAMGVGGAQILFPETPLDVGLTVLGGAQSVRATWGAVRGASVGANKTGTVWDAIQPVGPMHPGSVIPQKFELALESGGKIWVDGNATKHVAEYAAAKAINSTPEAVRLASQVQLESLGSAVNTAVQNGVTYRQVMNVNNWELIFAPPKSADQLPALYHALYKGK